MEPLPAPEFPDSPLGAMELPEQIEKFREFFEVNELYSKELHEQVRNGQAWVNIEFNDLAKFSPILADMLLDQPEDIIKACQIAIEKMDLPHSSDEAVPRLEPRFLNLPKQQHTDIRTIRAKHLNKFIQMVGIVRQKSDVRPQMTAARFECPSCGNIIPVLQIDQKFKEPSRCGCGRKGKFKMLSKELVDAQSITLEEAPEDLDGGEQPKRIKLFLKNDLVAPLTDKRTNPGAKITIVGTIKEVPIILATGGQSTRFDLIVEVNSIDSTQEDFSEIEISPEEEQEIRELSQDPDLFEKMVASIAPSIYGHEPIKQALLLQMFGGVHKSRDRGVKSRGDIHVLLIGDPGSGKCLAGETLIQLGDGSIKPIKQVFEEQQGVPRENENAYSPKSHITLPTLDAHGKESTSSVPTLWKRMEKENLLKITMRSGTTIVSTKDHPFFTTQHCLITPIMASDLGKGMPVACPRKLTPETALQPLPSWRESKANNAIRIKVPDYLNKSIARLLGYLAGDGCIEKARNGQPPSIISLTNNDDETINDYVSILSKEFGVTSTIRSPHKDKTVKEAYACSSSLRDLIVQAAPELLQLAGEKSVPQIVMRSPNTVVAQFLRGLFECDAHICPDRRSIQYSTKSKRMAEEVRMLLLRFGIQTRLRTKWKQATNSPRPVKREYYDVEISGEDVEKYKEHIGFVTMRKSSVFEKYTGRHNTNKDVLPGMCEFLQMLRKKQDKRLRETAIPIGSCRHYEKGDRMPSRTQMDKLLTAYDDKNDILYRFAKQFAEADIFWDFIERIEGIPAAGGIEVYDLEVKDSHNFIANCAVVHNSQMLKRISNIAPKARFVSGKGASGAGLTASVVKDEFLKGWALEAGALVLANRGICCTTEDAKFIKENGTLMSFGELFANETDEFIYPSFKVLGLNEKTLKIEPFEIKHAFRKRNNKRILKVMTRTGRELKLTVDNEVFACDSGKVVWKPIGEMRIGDYLAVPKRISLQSDDAYKEEFSHISGLVASDGHIRLDERHGSTSFYNANQQLILRYMENLDEIGAYYSMRMTPKGRSSVIRNKLVTTTQDGYVVLKSTKELAQELVTFGIPSGNKSSLHPLSTKILSYSPETIAQFLKGIFDGDGSIRNNPFEITLTTGIKENAELFQLLLTRLGIISSVKRSTHSWHCDIRGAEQCIAFLHKIGTAHPEKLAKLSAVIKAETKNRLDILPGHQELFKNIIGEKKGTLGKDHYRYLWNYSRADVAAPKSRLALLNEKIGNPELERHLQSDVLWDRIVALEEVEAEYVYDFTMKGTNNFIANNIIMHNCIDELDKMTKEDTSAMHEALEQQTVTISKANIQATLRSETTVLAAANPKFGRFDPYEIISKQIELPPTLLNRFDLIFPVRDMPDKTKDEKLASFILSLHKEEGGKEGIIDPEKMKKYIAYARQRCYPKLTEAAILEIKEYYVKMRGGDDNGEQVIKAIPISARQLEALVRLSEASAKMRLSEKVTKRDAQSAIELVHYCLQQIGMDPDTGKIDIDRITTGISASQRSHISLVKEIIVELEKDVGKMIPIDDVVREAGIKGVAEDTTHEVIEKLKRGGDIYSPKHGFVARL